MNIQAINKNEEMSMDNPPLITFPHLNKGDTFMFKGERVTVQELGKRGKGFWYINTQTLQKGYMSFEYYMSTPSAKGRKL